MRPETSFILNLWICKWGTEKLIGLPTGRLSQNRSLNLLHLLTRSVLWLSVLPCLSSAAQLHPGVSWPVPPHAASMSCRLPSGPTHLWKGERAWANPCVHQNTEPQGKPSLGSSFFSYVSWKWVDSSCYKVTIQNIAESKFFMYQKSNTSGINTPILVATLLFLLFLTQDLLYPSSACFRAQVVHRSLYPISSTTTKKEYKRSAEAPGEVMQSQMF